MMNLFNYKSLIDGNLLHIATVNKDGNPNLAVATDVKVISDNEIIISVNEMINTQKNIENNSNVVLTVFDKDYKGLRIFGKAKYYIDGEYYNMCMKTFFSEGQVTLFGATKPKGAIVVKVINVVQYE